MSSQQEQEIQKEKTLEECINDVAKSYGRTTMTELLGEGVYTHQVLISIMKEVALSYHASQTKKEFSREDVYTAINMARGITFKGDGTHFYHNTNSEIIDTIISNPRTKKD